MGGHSVLRTEQAFKVIADIANDLTKHGFQIVSGGGPGCMEAAHFGAYFAGSSDRAYEAALNQLKTQPRLIDLSSILNKDGSFAPNQEETIKRGYEWLTAALSARDMADGVPGVSLAIPTWVYGSEPTTPFASAYAKYFQNSIREETLITEGRTGVLYAKGGGGTLREIFQDVELNFYVRNAEAFTPMIFVDPDLFWEKDAVYDANDNVVRPGIKLDTTIASIFKMALPPKIRVDCKRKIQFTTDPETIRGVLEGHAPAAQKKLEMMLKGGAAALLTANGANEE
jgi:predicted Rossmann-fold nucleotide-binding protein